MFLTNSILAEYFNKCKSAMHRRYAPDSDWYQNSQPQSLFKWQWYATSLITGISVLQKCTTAPSCSLHHVSFSLSLIRERMVMMMMMKMLSKWYGLLFLKTPQLLFDFIPVIYTPKIYCLPGQQASRARNRLVPRFGMRSLRHLKKRERTIVFNTDSRMWKNRAHVNMHHNWWFQIADIIVRGELLVNHNGVKSEKDLNRTSSKKITIVGWVNKRTGLCEV